MNNKGFTEIETNIKTSNDFGTNEKPLKPNRVDINVLKSKLQKEESKEFKKNIYTLTFLISILAVLGIYLSLWLNLQTLSYHGLIIMWKKIDPMESNKIISKYLETITPKKQTKSSNINVLLNRVKINQKKEIRKKLYFSTAASVGLVLFGLILF